MPMTTSGTTYRHVVLVHGANHGAWCWFKIVYLLQKRGFTVAAIDLTSQGRDKTSPDSITTLDQFAKPLLDHLATLTGKAFLVGHSLGGITISYAMEKYAEKIEKAVFLTARMPLNNQSSHTSRLPNDHTVLERPSDYLVRIFANGPSAPPTSFAYNPKYLRDLFYNESPEEYVALATSMLSPTPYAVANEVLKLTPGRYGSIRRFYIFTLNDRISSPAAQQYTVDMNPPEQVFKIDSDHSPFFSKPRELTRLLQHIFHHL